MRHVLVIVLITCCIWNPAHAQQRGGRGRGARNVTVINAVLNGHSPVALVDQDALVPGNVAITAEFRGRTFFFASTAEQAAFMADPSRYTSQVGPRYRALQQQIGIGGYCPVSAVDAQAAIPGDATFAVDYAKKRYLMHDAAARDRFAADPAAYAEKANAALNAVLAAAKVVPGEPIPQPETAAAADETVPEATDPAATEPADPAPTPKQKPGRAATDAVK